MMAETTDDIAPELSESPKEADSGDNGALRQSGFVLVSGSGAEVPNLRQAASPMAPDSTVPSPPAPLGPPPPPAAPMLPTSEATPLGPVRDASASPPASLRQGSLSPPRNPYRGHLAHLQPGYSHVQATGHGHSHEHGHGHSHEHGGAECSGHHGAVAQPFFTPPAPATEAPLPPSLSPSAAPPGPAVAPPAFPLPQYQLPQFERQPPAAPTMQRDVGFGGGGHEAYVGVGMGDFGVEAQPQQQHQAMGSHGGSSAGFFSNLFGSDLVHKMVEKTKSGMETVITTLDPGMKEYIMGGGDVNVVIASVDNAESLPIRDAFYTVFGKSTIRCMAAACSLAPQLIGADAARQACEQRIASLRNSGQVPPDWAIVATTNFLSEPTSNRWFSVEYMLLQDPVVAPPVECEAYSLGLPVPPDLVAALRDSTPADYPARWSGSLQTLDQLLLQRGGLEPLHLGMPGPDGTAAADWRYAKFGLTRRDLIAQLARTVAREYKFRTRGHPGSPTPAETAVAFTS